MATPNCSISSSDGHILSELERLKDEKATLAILLSHKKDEQKDLSIPPRELKPLNIPGNPVTKFICDRCHHKGHRSKGNKGNRDCKFQECTGFQYCGLLTKHPEHKSAVTEVNKEISNLEKRIKSIDEEKTSIDVFLKHNTTNFISVLRPFLKSNFPDKYIGSSGCQVLQKDLRYLKIACNGKIPNEQNLTKDTILNLLRQGKSQTQSATNAASIPVVTSATLITSMTAPSTSMTAPSTYMMAPSTSMTAPSTSYSMTALQGPQLQPLAQPVFQGWNLPQSPYTGYSYMNPMLNFNYMNPMLNSSPYNLPMHSPAQTSYVNPPVFPPLPPEDPPENPPLPPLPDDSPPASP